MWKAPASILCGCLTALSLIGCAADVGNQRQAAQPMPAAITGPAAPAAVVVLLPGIGGIGDPGLWAAQGFDVVMPPDPADIFRLVADQRAALARLVASAPPLWLVGPGPAIEAALAGAPQFGRGAVSGVVVTSVTSNAGTCRESMLYSDPGTGAPPKVEVRSSGDCGAGSPAAIEPRRQVLPQPPGAAPRVPRIIEASALPKNLPPAAQVRRLAQIVKVPAQG